MADAPRDANRTTTLLGVSSIDDTTPIPIRAGVTSKALRVELAGSSNTAVPTGNEGELMVGNSSYSFRNEFVNGIDATIWDSSIDASDIVIQGGNAAASSYLRISKSPLTTNTETSITSVRTFAIPYKFGAGLSLSQRLLGQEFSFEFVGVDANNAVSNNTSVANVAISGNITVSANVWTINTSTAHGLHGNDRIVITGCQDPRLNVGPVNVTDIVSTTSFTITSTLASSTYTVGAGGHVVWADAFNYAKNAASYLFENTTVTNATFATRRNGSSYRNVNSTVATTTAGQTSTAQYTDAFNSASNHELFASIDEVSFRSITPDGVATPSGLNKWSQGIPDATYNYKIRFRAKNLPNFTVPIARITTISKSGSTTATVTTDVPHNLTTSDFVQIYGVLNQTDYPNTVAQTAVASVIDGSNFTIVIGATTPTNSSSEGAVIRNQGSVLTPALNFAIASIQRTSNILTVTLNTTATTALPGEYFHIYGMNVSAQPYEGGYKVLQITGSTILLQSTGADFGLITTGGFIIKRTDYRIHFVKALDYNPLVADIVGGRGNSTDINNAVPVSAAGGTITTVSTVTALTTLTTATSLTQMSGFILKDTLLNATDYNQWANAVRQRIT